MIPRDCLGCTEVILLLFHTLFSFAQNVPHHRFTVTIIGAHIRMRGVMVMINVETTLMRKTVQMCIAIYNYICPHVHAVTKHSHGIYVLCPDPAFNRGKGLCDY